jgi:hypothetical protein
MGHINPTFQFAGIFSLVQLSEINLHKYLFNISLPYLSTSAGSPSVPDAL